MKTTNSQEGRPPVGEMLNQANGTRKFLNGAPSGGEPSAAPELTNAQANEEGQMVVSVSIDRLTAENINMKIVSIFAPGWVPKHLVNHLHSGFETVLGGSSPKGSDLPKDSHR